MKKLYLTLMLFLGSVGACLAQYSAKYDFTQTSLGNYETFTFLAPTLTVNLENGGYNDAWGESELTVKIPTFTFNSNGANPKIFAFNTIEVKNSWETRYHPAWRQSVNGDDGQWVGVGIKNMAPLNNVFSVLNLRAGEIVKVRSMDNNPILTDVEKQPLKNRFIVEHSPNAIDNKPWANPNQIDNDLLIYTQEFIMTEDGNLDLKVAPWLKIFDIEIVSNYKNFEKGRAHVGTPINVTIPNRKATVVADYTSEVNQWGWSRWNSNTNSSEALTGTPNTTNGTNPTSVTNLREYFSNTPHYPGNDGHLIWNVTNNLPEGAYHVEVYATSHNTVGSNNFTDGDETIAYIYAKGSGDEQKAFFPAYNSGTLNASYEPFVRGFDVNVGSNGTLELGLGLAQGGKTNWHCIQIKSLTKLEEANDRFVQAEPVVLYRGDLTPGTVSTTKNSDGNWNITVSGFKGKQYNDGYWEGGTILVMLDETMYSYAVPYKVATTNTNATSGKTADFASWNLWQNPLKVGRSDQEPYQSLLVHDINNGTYGLDNMHTADTPQYLFRYRGKMNGQNAYFHPETAGIIFEAPDPEDYSNNPNDLTHGKYQYGVINELVDNTEPEDKRDDLYGSRYIGICTGATMTIPELTKGDEVWVYIDHYGSAAAANNPENSCLGLKIWNATDALQKRITDGEELVLGGSTWGPTFFNSNKDAKVYVGAMHFFAAEDGDMKFEVTGYNKNCMAKVAYVRIVKHNTEQNIITRTNELLWYDNSGVQGYEFLTTQDANGTYHTTTGSFGLHECGRGNMNQTYEVLEASGTLNAYNIGHTNIDGVIGTWNCNPGHANCMKFRYTSQEEPTFGSFLLRGKDWDRNNKYVVDYADRVISVGFRQTMNYPYTWDFTDILKSTTGNSQNEYDAAFARVRPEGSIQPNVDDGKVDSTAVWVNTGGVISLQNNRIKGQNNRTLASGTQLFANNTYIEEAAGLGWATINMDYAFNNSIQIIDGGVKIQTYNGWENRLYVPEIKQDGRLYVRGWKLNDGKGFVCKALKEGPMGPNTFKKRTDDRVDLIPLLETGQIESVFNYEANFSNLIEGQQDITGTKQYDDNLSAIVGGPATKMEERLGSDRNVDNPSSLYDEANYESRITVKEEWTYEYDNTGNVIEGSGKKIYIVTEDNNVYLNDFSTIGLEVSANKSDYKDKALFDKNVSLCTTVIGNPISDAVFNNFIYTGGSGKATPEAGRYLKVTLPASDYGFNVTVVARSQNSRQINVFAGDTWGNKSNALATMVLQDNLSAKTLEAPAGTTSLLIGSDNSSVEIYAIYVEENKTVNASDPEPWAGYVDVAASDGGVTLYLNDIIIEKMAYTTDHKNLNDIGWASESRDHYIDHSLTEYFTNNPVKAYVTTGTVKTNGLINSINIVQLGKEGTSNVMQLDEEDVQSITNNDTYAGNGCILYNDIPDKDITDEDGKLHPTWRKAKDDNGNSTVWLFVPDIHDYMKDEFMAPGTNNTNFKGDALTNGSPISTGAKSHANAACEGENSKIYPMTGNKMVANVKGNPVAYSGNDANYTNYVLSYYYKDKQGVNHPTADEIADEKITQRFVRVGKYNVGNGIYGATMSPNSAYLILKTDDVKPQDWEGTDPTQWTVLINFDGEEFTDPDGIDEIDLSTAQDESENGTDEYYTLSGQKINKPSKAGIYIKNGKKVYVK